MTSSCSVIFRVDESVRVGFGHMSRCRALAEALLHEGAKVTFYCLDIRTDTQVELEKRGILVVRLLTEEMFLNQDWRGTIIVVDGYQFGEGFWQKLLAGTPRRTVCIDDWRNEPYQADLVICYNEGINASQFRLGSATKLLLGGRYMLLRPEIHRAAGLLNVVAPRHAVMLAVGGTRLEQWIIDMLLLLAKAEPNGSIWILSGRRISEGKVARRAGLNPARVRFFSGLNALEMLRLYRRARYLIAPASTLMLEAFTVGCPLISGWIAPNQKISLDFYDRSGLLVNVGKFSGLSLERFVHARDLALRRGSQMIRDQRAYSSSAVLGIGEIVQSVLSTQSL